MKTKEIQSAVEVLKAQNSNGQFDQVIKSLEQQLDAETPVEVLNEQWGLSRKEYGEVKDAFALASDKRVKQPLAIAYDLNDNQLKFLSHLIAEWKDFYGDEWDDRLDKPLDREELYQTILDDPETYFDINEKIDEEFTVLGEDDIFDVLKKNLEDSEEE